VGEPQAPFWQVSPDVHALPSSHAMLFPFGGFVQTPVEVSHVPTT
jgi:hypothetical protein